MFVEKPIADTRRGRGADPRRVRRGRRGADGRPRASGGSAPRAARRGAASRRGSATVVLAEATLLAAGQARRRQAWRAHRERNPGGPLMQLGIHHVDTLAVLARPGAPDDRPLRARAHRGRHRRRRRRDARVRVGRARRAHRLLRLAAHLRAAAAGHATACSTTAPTWAPCGPTRRARRRGLDDHASDGEPVAFEPRDMLAEELRRVRRWRCAARRRSRPAHGEGIAALRVILDARSAP